jgi:hypothetical protein
MALSPGTDLAQQWANQINDSVGDTVKSIVATGNLLIQAKKALKVKRGWLRMFKDHREPIAQPLRIGRLTAQRYMAIARHPIIANASTSTHLPPNWTGLYALTTLPDPVLEWAIADGRIHPDITQREIRAMIRTAKGEPPISPAPRQPKAGTARIDRAALVATLPATLAQPLTRVEQLVLDVRFMTHRAEVARYLRDLADSVRPYYLEQQEDAEHASQ